jgi:hypothetical protein
MINLVWQSFRIDAGDVTDRYRVSWPIECCRSTILGTIRVAGDVPLSKRTTCCYGIWQDQAYHVPTDIGTGEEF